jgi:hypothetical protein
MAGLFVVWGVTRREDHVEVSDAPFRVAYGHVWGDALANPAGEMVVSDRLAGLIRALYVPHVELVPLELEGAPRPYFHIAPLGLVPSLVDVPADRQIFRVEGQLQPIYLRRGLAQIIAEVGLSGPECAEPG